MLRGHGPIAPDSRPWVRAGVLSLHEPAPHAAPDDAVRLGGAHAADGAERRVFPAEVAGAERLPDRQPAVGLERKALAAARRRELMRNGWPRPLLTASL